MSKEYPWNNKIVHATFWDVNAEDGKGAEFIENRTIKGMLENPSGMRLEDVMMNCAQGLARVVKK